MKGKKATKQPKINPKISIVIPFHWMENWPVFLTRCLASIEMQTFKDYEIVLVKHSTMPITSNRAMESARGELVKILYMDDYFAHEKALEEIVENFKDDAIWMATGCLHDSKGDVGNYHSPVWSEYLSTGANSIGSPSVITLRRDKMLFFDEELSWMLDCDLYQRLGKKYGEPVLLDTPNVIIGLHSGQTTYQLTDEQKNKETIYVKHKHS